MGRDVISHLVMDTQAEAAAALQILLVATDKEREPHYYSSAYDVLEDFGEGKIYRKVKQLFDQGATTKAESLFQEVLIVGFTPPETPAELVDKIESFRQNFDEWDILLTDNDTTEFQEALKAFAESTEPSLSDLESGVEDHRKFYFGQTNDKSFAIAHSRDAIFYVDDLDQEADAAYLGNVGPFYPKRVTWKFKRPNGVSVADLTEREKSTLEKNNINYLTSEYHNIYAKNGVCTDGEYIDTRLGADFLVRNVRQKLYSILLDRDDIPYSDTGFTLIGSKVIEALEEGVEYGIIATGSNGRGIYSIKIPTLAQATQEQKSKGEMPVIYWEAEVERSVHSIKVRGVFSLTLRGDQE